MQACGYNLISFHCEEEMLVCWPSSHFGVIIKQQIKFERRQ